MRARSSRLRAEASRPAREGTRAELLRLHAVLSIAGTTDPEGTLEPELFAGLEGLRLAEHKHAHHDVPVAARAKSS